MRGVTFDYDCPDCGRVSLSGNPTRTKVGFRVCATCDCGRDTWMSVLRHPKYGNAVAKFRLADS